MQGGFIYEVAIGVCIGIALSLLFGMGLVLAGFCLMGSAVLALFGRKSMPLLIIASGLSACALGLIRTEHFLLVQQQETLVQHVGQTVTVGGIITSDPDRRETSLRVNVKVGSVDNERGSGMLLAVLPREAHVSYGDFLQLRGKLALPQAFETDTGHIFDYPAYLRVQGVSVLMQYATIEEVSAGGWSVQKALFDTKHAFERSLEKLLPEPDASLLEGVLLGERRGIPRELTNAFAQSGLIHVVVLSGYNISVVSDAAIRTFSFLPRTAGFCMGGITMVLFALMTGAGATTVRAVIMGLIAIMARYARRPSVALRSLASAAAGMALWNPPALLFDPSFILSVLATFGLITLSPWVEGHLPKIILRFPSIASIAASTIAVQLFVLPALLYFTGILSFFALPANSVVLPVVPLAMLAGFVAGLVSFIHPVFAFVPALVADVLLKWMMFAAHTAALLPFASATIPQFPAWIAAFMYLPLTWCALRIYQRGEKVSAKE